jgi:hypothetical protein
MNRHSYMSPERAALQETAAWLLAAHGARLTEVTLLLEYHCGDPATYWGIDVSVDGAPENCETQSRDELGALAETIFRRLLPTARFERSSRDTDLAEYASLYAMDLTAHLRLALLRRHGTRATVMLESVKSAIVTEGRR